MKFTKIPVNKITSIPRSGSGVIIKRDHYWYLTDDKCVLCYGKSSFQCNPNKELVESMAKSVNYPYEGAVVLIPVVYIPITLYDFSYDIEAIQKHEKTKLTLWHPESPGMKVDVSRNWFQRLMYPKDFATLGESIKG